MSLCLCVSSCPPPSLFAAPPCGLTGWWPSPAPTYFTSRREFLGELSPTPSWRKSSSPKRYSRSSLCVVSVDPLPILCPLFHLILSSSVSRHEATGGAHQAAGLGPAQDREMVPGASEPGPARHAEEVLREHVSSCPTARGGTDSRESDRTVCTTPPHVSASLSALRWRLTFYLGIFIYAVRHLWVVR